MNPTRNDLPAKSRSTTADLLNARLAELLDLRSQVKQAHWNMALCAARSSHPSAWAMFSDHAS